MFPSGTDKHCFPYAVVTVEHWRIHHRVSGIQLVFCQGRSMLAGLKLGAHILQRLIHVFEDLFGILTVIAIRRKIRRDKLGFGGTTGIDDVRLPMFDGYAVSHSLVSSTVCAPGPGQTRPTVKCTVSEDGCQIKTSALRVRPMNYFLIDGFDIRPNTRDYSIFTGFWYGSRGAFVV